MELVFEHRTTFRIFQFLLLQLMGTAYLYSLIHLVISVLRYRTA